MKYGLTVDICHKSEHMNTSVFYSKFYFLGLFSLLSRDKVY